MKSLDENDICKANSDMIGIQKWTEIRVQNPSTELAIKIPQPSSVSQKLEPIKYFLFITSIIFEDSYCKKNTPIYSTKTSWHNGYNSITRSLEGLGSITDRVI